MLLLKFTPCKHGCKEELSESEIREEGEMGYHSFLRSPKKEEQQVPDAIETEFVDLKDEDLDGIWGFNENVEKFSKDNIHQQLAQFSWDFMHRDQGFIHSNGQQEEEEEEEQEEERSEEQIDEFRREFFPQVENLGFWDEDESNKVASLNLNLNYQDVLDAWSDRGPLWADEYSLSMASNGYHVTTQSERFQ